MHGKRQLKNGRRCLCSETLYVFGDLVGLVRLIEPGPLGRRLEKAVKLASEKWEETVSAISIIETRELARAPYLHQICGDPNQVLVR